MGSESAILQLAREERDKALGEPGGLLLGEDDGDAGAAAREDIAVLKKRIAKSNRELALSRRALGARAGCATIAARLELVEAKSQALHRVVDEQTEIKEELEAKLRKRTKDYS